MEHNIEELWSNISFARYNANDVEEGNSRGGNSASNVHEVIVPHRQYGSDIKVKSIGEILLGEKNVIDKALDAITVSSRKLHRQGLNSEVSSIDSQANIMLTGAVAAVMTLVSGFKQGNGYASAIDLCGIMLASASADY